MTTKYSKRRSRSAFSLVEVVIALGVVTFACVSLLALLANGLVTVNHAIGNTVEADIVQSVVNASQVYPYSPTFSTNLYFDNEGGSVVQANAVYGATVTAVPLVIPAAAPANQYTFQTTSGSMLQVTVTNRAFPGVVNSFSLIWANSGK